MERERETASKLGLEVEQLHKYFEPKKVLNILKKQKLEELPTYLALYEKYIASQ